MKIIKGNLFDFAKEGYIVHQVNCMNAMGSGFAREFAKRYPIVKSFYHNAFQSADGTTIEEKGKTLYGKVMGVEIQPNLYGCNSFTQFYFGNSAKTKKNYTDEELLVRNILYVVKKAEEKGLNVYIPYGIGCDLAGGDWTVVEKGLNGYENIIVVKLK